MVNCIHDISVSYRDSEVRDGCFDLLVLGGEMLGPFRLGPNDDNQGIYTGDSKEMVHTIPDESVDLVFCDPIYQNLDDYRWLAETAARILKPDRACLVWCSQPMLSACREVLEQHLRYVYTLTYTVPAKTYRMRGYHLFVWSTPCLWMNKGKFFPSPWVPDTIISTSRSANGYKWNKNPEGMMTWMRGFTKPGDIVFDPFVGSGTVPVVCKMLERRWLAFEIEKEVAEGARERVRNAQPPIPGLVVEQGEMKCFG